MNYCPKVSLCEFGFMFSLSLNEILQGNTGRKDLLYSPDCAHDRLLYESKLISRYKRLAPSRAPHTYHIAFIMPRDT